MELQYEYTRKRKEFGKHPKFGDSGNVEICNIEPNDELAEAWSIRPVTEMDIDCIPSVAEHEVSVFSKKLHTSIQFYLCNLFFCR